MSTTCYRLQCVTNVMMIESHENPLCIAKVEERLQTHTDVTHRTISSKADEAYKPSWQDGTYFEVLNTNITIINNT